MPFHWLFVGGILHLFTASKLNEFIVSLCLCSFIMNNVHFIMYLAIDEGSAAFFDCF